MCKLLSFQRASYFRALGVICLFSLICGVSAEYEYFDPTEMGPYPVGVTTMEFIDHSRTDQTTKGPRTLITEIWYPATEETRDLPKNNFSDFYARGLVPEFNKRLEQFISTTLEEVDGRFQNEAVRDARIRDGKYPLIVFSHGNGGIRGQNTFWCDYLASHGYVIMSPDHTGNCAVALVDGKVIPYNVGQMLMSAQDRPIDVIFLIDQMLRMNGGTDSRFTGRIDTENIGVAGHSYGGYTSAAVIDRDPRVKAIIPMTPVWQFRKNYTTPFLMFLGTEDKTIGVRGNEQARKRYEESRGPHYLVEILDGGHFTFTDMFQADPDFGDGVGEGERVTMPGEKITYLPMEESYEIINNYSAAFFGLYLKGIDRYSEYLEKNHFGDKIIHKFAIPTMKTE